MKRLVWLLLLAFGSLLVQVPAVEPLAPVQPHCACGAKCCGHCGCGGMPDCALPAASATPHFTANQGLTLAQPTAKRSARRGANSSVSHRFFASLAALKAQPTFCAPVWPAPAASVPLFQAHCSFLL